ncbi:hypothetical protein Purlil1_5342 [Purpureocillium lilacinum]|uniref:Uncharacterized protein n=1 Tax=Purpureocillium lilacinum TaxID=33203 RepID=A0ABR0C254_PURLI|nr:hypothetical protein Purlil1_5342 [Purpureocillium lilacinum]
MGPIRPSRRQVREGSGRYIGRYDGWHGSGRMFYQEQLPAHPGRQQAPCAPWAGTPHHTHWASPEPVVGCDARPGTRLPLAPATKVSQQSDGTHLIAASRYAARVTEAATAKNCQELSTSRRTAGGHEQPKPRCAPGFVRASCFLGLCDALASLCTGAWGRILVCALPHPAKVVIYDAKNHHCNGTQSQFVVRRDDCGRVKKEAFWPQLPGPTAWQGGAQTGRRKGLPDATSESHVSDQASAFSTLDIPGLLPLASSSYFPFVCAPLASSLLAVSQRRGR